MSEIIQHVAQRPETGATVSALTVTTGLGTALEWIPTDIGKLAVLIGMVLSIVLIWVHLLTVKKIKLETKILQQKENDRRELAAHRRESGQPVRRADDK